jgi:hypothetical protein
MGSIARFNLSKIKNEFDVNQLIETGTGHGKSIEITLNSSISSIFSCESHMPLFTEAKKKFANEPSHLN